MDKTVDQLAIERRVMEKLGLADARVVQRVIATTLALLGEACSSSLASSLAARLPGELGRSVSRTRRHDVSMDAVSIGRRVARIAGLRASAGPEIVQVVCAAIGECLDDEWLARARRELATSLVDALTPATPAATSRHPSHGARRTISSGRPGPTRSLSSAKDTPEAPEHRYRLSTAPGLRHEAAGETLARAKR